MIQFVSFKANYKTLKCYVIEMYFMQIFNKISLQLQNIYKVKSGRGYLYHRCQPLRFFRNCYEFRANITVLRSTVCLLRISDYCRPGTVPHLNIIVIIQTLHCLVKSRNDKRLRDFDYLILLGFSGLSIVENDLSISCSIPSS